MNKYKSGSGWHFQSVRHSLARRTGHAGGHYADELRLVSAKKKIKASEEFKVGDIIDTQGHSNMKGRATIREIKGNSLYFTDAEGTDYSGMSRSTVRNLINGGEWEHISIKETKDFNDMTREEKELLIKKNNIQTNEELERFLNNKMNYEK